jgi:predicted dehydrogenase
MLKVCINRQTGGDRRGGHYTHYAFTGLPGVDIAALADANPEAKDNFHLCGAKKLYASYEEMMETEKPDIVILCSRLPHEHYTEIKYALNHHCHVLCEKPLADDLPHAYELAELSRQTDCKVQMAHLARFAPTFQKMKQMISAGEIGRVLTCYMRGKEDTRGGGEDMLVLGTHLFDAACWIFGLPEMVYADVRVQNRPITNHDSIETTEPLGPCAGDDIFAHFRFANGINGIFESRRGLVPAVADPRMGITVCGTEGILTIRYTNDRSLRLCRNFPVPVEDHNQYETVQLPEPEEIPGAAPIDPEVWQINPDFFYQVYFAENNRRAAWDLLQAIKNKQEPLAGIDSAIHSLEMIIGIYQSAINHMPAALPLKDRRHPLS